MWSLCAVAVAAAPPAIAQDYESSLLALEYAPDALARSPRLVGMGRLTLADDRHNRINLWDFAGNPAGIAESDSMTTLEYRPIIRASTSARDITGLTPIRQRQILRARQMLHEIELWRRSGRTAYGLDAAVSSLEVDRPYDLRVENRNRFTVPAILGAVNARVPWLGSDRFDYALRIGHWLETHSNRYYEFYDLPQGEFLGKPSAIVDPPDLFSPDRFETSALRGGVALSMRVTSGIRAAVGYDRARLKIKSTQIGERSTSQLDEKRPFDIGQASLVGRFGSQLEWGIDGRAWRARSEEFFFWSLSAGPTADPLSGRGKRLDRDEEGTSLKSRLRWTSGSLELGAGFGTSYRRTVVTPWYPTRPGDAAGFNDFLDLVGFRPGADTLRIPERVLVSRVESRGYEFSGGASWSLPGDDGTVGVEVHRWKRHDLELAHNAGPEPVAWDVRAGIEFHVNPSLRARGGVGYGIDDRDDLTSDDAYRRSVATLGLGFQPGGTGWGLDAGYAFEWVLPDFADPTSTREYRQQLAVQMRWPF
jgi:hypothetical protein